MILNFNFDYNNRYLSPTLVLCNPNFEELEVILLTKDLRAKYKFNGVSELSFSVPEKSNNLYGESVNTASYELIQKNRIIKIVDVGYFVIAKVDEKIDGAISIKEVVAYSYEYVLNRKSANILDGTYKLYDPLDIENSLLGILTKNIPSWSIEHVDAGLWNRYRTFEGVDGQDTLYKFLMSNVQESYGCLFSFDILNKRISVYEPNSVIRETDIVLRLDNLIKELSIEGDDSGIKTKLSVYGGSGLTINSVNPLGTSDLYNFNYYKTTDWMSQELINAINIWEDKIKNSKESYSNTLIILKDLNTTLITLQGNLEDLKNELKALEQTRTAQMPKVLSSVTTQINNKITEISNKNKEIAAKESEISHISMMLKEINSSLSFANNFTENQLKLLDDFIDSDTYTNENFEITSIMNNVDIMEMSQQLYEHGIQQLNQISQPCLKFKMDSVNFLFMKKFLPFIDQIQLGCKIYVDYKNGEWLSPILLEIELDYENPDSFSLTFGNRFKITDDLWTIQELMGDVKSTTSSVKANGALWSQPVKSGTIDAVTQYMTNALDTSTQEIVNSRNQSVTIGEYGIRSRKLLDDGSYSPEQLWMNNGLICMTDNNWQTSKLAIGNIEGVYSINAEVVAGNLIAGNQLKIMSEDSSFVVDGNGTKITNADITLVASNNRSKMVLSPIQGIKIQTSLDGSTWTDKFYVNPMTNTLVFAGEAMIESGTIGGWKITTNGIESTANYIKSNGTGKLGLMTWTPTAATFDGYIFAKNLDAEGITTSKLADGAVTRDKLDRIYATEAYVDSLVADYATIGQLNAQIANIKSLIVTEARVRNLISQTVTSQYFAGVTVNIGGVSAGNVRTTNLYVNTYKYYATPITVGGHTYTVLARGSDD